MEIYGVEILMPFMLSLIGAAVLGPILIPILQRIKAGQTVRDDGPESHLIKNGTPTMGGFIFLIPYTAVSIYYISTKKAGSESVAMLISVLGFALIGFIDDFIKVVLKRSMGLRAWQKFLLQGILAAGLVYYLYTKGQFATAMLIPFTNIGLELGTAAYVITVIAILGTVNGSNFTDGLDGLASSVTAVIGAFFVFAGLSFYSAGVYSSAAMAGSLLGFLLYNSHKASVFMGDTGSLALGGYVAIAAAEMRLTLLIPVIAFIYVAEVASVILQVGYFKLTKGKRIFRMAPIHHHFELCGWRETKVVAVFTIITAALCALSAFNLSFNI